MAPARRADPHPPRRDALRRHGLRPIFSASPETTNPEARDRMPISRRELLRNAALAGAALLLPGRLDAAMLTSAESDRQKLARWLGVLRRGGLARGDATLGRATARVGELALGSPYAAHTFEAYLAAGGSPASEPLTLDLSRFDCVSLVESALGVARTAAQGPAAGWNEFARQVERMRYRGGVRAGYDSRLHYFSEWISDNAARGLVRDLGPELGAVDDARPLRFMSTHRDAYLALKNQAVFENIVQMEHRLDPHPRQVIRTDHIPAVMDRIHTGDVLAFATSVEGLDASHTGLAYRGRDGVLRVLHAPLSGGQVTISRGDLHAYVAGIGHSTGVMVARPLIG